MFILYKKRKSLNKRNLEGYHFDNFMQVMKLKIILLMHVSQISSTHASRFLSINLVRVEIE